MREKARRVADTKSDRIYETLREAIVTGELLPRERLHISDLASRFEVSEIPVREALKRLQDHRLINFIPYTGYFVKEFSMEETENTWMIRSALEHLAIRQAVEKFDGNPPPAIADHMKRMEEAVQADDHRLFRVFNKEFHLEIYRISGNRRLVELIDDLWEEIERAARIFRIYRARPADSVREHSVMLDALQARDVVGLERILDAHRETNLQILKQLREEEKRLAI